ncbi:MAG: methylmalonyl-CoA mutase subunit beta [Nonlabens sp.]
MKLFEEFDAVSEAQWKQKIQMDLKGADYNDTLVTTTASGINIKPIYHSDSSDACHIPSRGTATGDWYISQKIYGGNAAAANKKIHDVLRRGAQGVVIVIPHDQVDLATLLKDLPKNGVQIHPQFLNNDYNGQIHRLLPNAYLHVDPIHKLASEGNWFTSQKNDLDNWKNLIADYSGYFSNITINTSTYQQAGATVVQELAYYAAHLNEYLNVLNDGDGLSAFAKAEKRINLDTVIGPDYFTEIAKYRAYRIITRSVGKLYGINLDTYITASPSKRNKSIMDYNVNMLRTTTECMSAVLGGADTILNLPYDAFFNKENEFGDRIARNQLLILKDEAYLDRVNNPASGAYFIETLTRELVQKSLSIFKELEKAGGLIASLHAGTIQRKIKESASREEAAFKHGDRILVGVNKFLDAGISLQKEYEILPFVKIEPRKTLVTPIVEKRLAEELEKESIAKR